MELGLAEKKAVLETLTVAEMSSLVQSLGLMQKGRGSGAQRSRLLSLLAEALEATPVHANNVKVSAPKQTWMSLMSLYVSSTQWHNIHCIAWHGMVSGLLKP